MDRDVGVTSNDNVEAEAQSSTSGPPRSDRGGDPRIIERVDDEGSARVEQLYSGPFDAKRVHDDVSFCRAHAALGETVLRTRFGARKVSNL